MNEDISFASKLAITGIGSGVTAVGLGIMGANAFVDLAIAGMVGTVLWGFSPELQEKTEKVLPKVKIANVPILNRVDWKAVFTESEIGTEEPAALHEKQEEVQGEDAKLAGLKHDLGVDNWVNDLEEAPAQGRQKNIFLFSELLATGWRPSWNEIFVGRTSEGKNIFVPALDLCHVAFAGKSGGGKGSLERMIVVQLCYIGAPVALLNPHYMRWVVAKEGPKFAEDWSPFEGVNPRTGKHYLERSPVASAEMVAIDGCLTWAVEGLLEKRKRVAHTQGINFMPYFIVIDEWPSIVGKLGNRIAKTLGYLLREGRKFRIYVIITSQDFQVKTLGCEGQGSVRGNFWTVFYTGGDLTTRRELLNEQTRETPENKIGKGVVLMRCTGTDNECVLAHVPFVDNEAVYTLLGESTYEEPVEEVHTEDLQITDDATRHAPQNVAPTEHDTEPIIETPRATRQTPDERMADLIERTGWTQEEIEHALWSFNRCHNQDKTCDVTRGNHGDRNRDALYLILVAYGLIKEREEA